MKFEITPEQYATFHALKPQYRMNNKKLALHEISIPVKYAIASGYADVRGILGKWGKLVGSSAPFVLGTHAFLVKKFKLKSVALTDCDIDPRGAMQMADITLSFIEDP